MTQQRNNLVRQSAASEVTLTRAEYDQLVRDADCWRTLMSSPHTSALIGEYIEWCERRDLSEVAATLASGMDWRAYASGSVSYAKLERRRGVPTFRRCDFKSCMEDGAPHRTPQTGAQVVLCASHSHHGIPEQQAASTAHSGVFLGVAA